jgi:hypothetical protein
MVSLHNSTCPQCRRHFTHVRHSTIPQLEYEVATHSLLPDLCHSSPTEMSIAVNLIFNENGRGGYDVFMPEYITCIAGMDSSIIRIRPFVNEDIAYQEDKAIRFEQMKNLVHHVQNRPFIYTKTIIARCIMSMVDIFNIFHTESICLCDTCLDQREVQRVTTRPADPRENEGGLKLFLLSTS